MMKIFELVNIIEKDGWYKVRQKGSHIQYKHAVKKGIVTIAFHGINKEVLPKTLKSVLKQAQIDE